jgi:hypothetical protein
MMHSPPRLPLLALAAAVLGLLTLGAAHVAAQEKLTTTTTTETATIDRLIADGWNKKGVTPSRTVDDRAFARRLYLDLVGRIPTAEEADAFAADKASAKRIALVDRLLAGPEYARRMRDVFDVVFMGRAEPNRGRRRRGQEAGGNFRGQWLTYLERSFAENRPWDRVAREILLARPQSAEERGAVWFLYARQEKYQEIAETVSPAIFGVQVQCAQCHDHPIAPEIKQAHYWGLVSFFNRGKNRTSGGGPSVSEAATGGFNNFANLSGQSSPAELTFLNVPPIPETRPAEGVKEMDTPELYRPPAAMPNDDPPVPKFSRREQFVDRVVKGNPLVARAAVNRFWALLMGRGIVHPVDKMDSQHAPSDPELLDTLAREFEATGYDVKRLVRSIVLSRAYQLDSRHDGKAGPELFAYGLEKPLTAEALYRSLLVATTGKADAENPELKEALIEIFPDVFAEENLSNLRQTMFLTNNGMVEKLVQSTGSPIAQRLSGIADPAARVKEAFRLAYSREPDAEELKATTAYLAARADRSELASSQLLWALLAGAEFRFNH